MKRLLAVAGVAAVLLLSGCSTPDNSGQNSREWYITALNDPSTGRTVTCAINGYTNASGIDCDWDGAK